MIQFDTTLRGEEVQSSLPIIILAVDETKETAFYVDGDGNLKVAPLGTIKVNWRFSFEQGKWVDINHMGEVVPDPPADFGQQPGREPA
jgi:hypothetical protein